MPSAAMSHRPRSTTRRAHAPYAMAQDETAPVPVDEGGARAETSDGQTVFGWSDRLVAQREASNRRHHREGHNHFGCSWCSAGSMMTPPATDTAKLTSWLRISFS